MRSNEQRLLISLFLYRVKQREGYKKIEQWPPWSRKIWKLLTCQVVRRLESNSESGPTAAWLQDAVEQGRASSGNIPPALQNSHPNPQRKSERQSRCWMVSQVFFCSSPASFGLFLHQVSQLFFYLKSSDHYHHQKNNIWNKLIPSWIQHGCKMDLLLTNYAFPCNLEHSNT